MNQEQSSSGKGTTQQGSQDSISSEGANSQLTCKDQDEINLHVWALLKETQNRCCLFTNYKVKLASLGDDHVLFLTRDHTVFSFGGNKYGQLGLGDTEPRGKPCQVTGLSEKSVSRIVSGARHSGIVCKNGQVYCWGDSRQGQCGVGKKGLFTTPCRVQFVESNVTTVTKIRELSCGGMHTLAIDYKGFIWVFGTGAAMGLGPNIDEVLLPTKMKSLSQKRAVAISAGELHSLAILQEDFHGSHFSAPDDCENDFEVGDAVHTRADTGATIPFLENEFYAIQDSSWESSEQSVFDNPQECASALDPDASTNLPREGMRSMRQENSIMYIEDSSSESCTTLDDQQRPRSRRINQTFANRLFDSGSTPHSSHNISENESSRDSLPAFTFTNRLFEENNESTNVSQISDLFETSCSTLVASDGEGAIGRQESQHMTLSELQLEWSSPGVSKDIESSSPQKLGHNTVDISTGEIFKSALDIFPSDGENRKLFDTSPETIAIASGVNEPKTDSTTVSESNRSEGSVITICSNTNATSDWEIKKEPYSSHQPSKSNIFPFKTSQERRKRHPSTWSLVSTVLPSELDHKGSSVPIAGRTEVWGWGKNTYGQLGTNNTVDSRVPVCVEKLSMKGVVRVAAGAYHSLALTNYCQVYAWGDNSFGQIAHKQQMNLLPKRMKMLSDVRVWDIGAGRSLSLFLGDNCDAEGSDVYFCGNTEKKTERSVSNPTQDMSVQEKKKAEKKWRKISQRGKRTSDGAITPLSLTVDIRKIVHFKKDIVMRSVDACNSQFSCLTERNSDSHLEAIYAFAYSERAYYCQLAMIQFVVIEPMKQTDHWTTNTKLPGGEALLRMIDSFNDLLNSVAAGLSQLTDVVRQGRTARDLFSFLLSDSFRGTYDRFSTCYCDALAIGLIHLCNRVISSIIAKSRDAMKKALKNHELPSLDFEYLLKIPLTRHKQYQKAVEECTNAMKKREHYKDTDIIQLEEVRNRWLLFEETNTLRLKEAEETRLYWEECPHKLMEALKEPQRRLLRTSKTEPLSLARASRLSNHSYVLFNDVLVHIQFNRNFQVFPLVTMWAEPEKDTEQVQNAIRISAPEQSFLLCASTSAGKIAWLCEINKAIASCLSVSSSHCIDITAVNMTSGTLPAAVARDAWYTFVNHPRYKAARYTGMWLSGQPHGRGRLEWPDGIYYEGEFVKGNFQGFGIMVYPPSGQGEQEKRYEGEWVEGKMRGYGKMSYGNKDEYLGHWSENVRQGHGTMRHYSTSSSLQTVYIGDWVNDQRHGYGVLDLIVRGEKYMGMWANDQRHGQGIVVTVDGVYYEGKFVQNKLVGKGVLLSDDDTCYEGEFTADMLLNGKGILTFQNGDFIDGTFYGKWGEGIKLNGSFFKFGNPDPSLQGETGLSHTGNSEFTIPADLKWKSLFYECKESLGYDGILEPNEYAVWASVQDSIIRSQALSSLRRQTRADFGQELLTQGGKIENRAKLVQDLKSLQNYLERAFDTFGHPLNTLVDSLVEVYRTTYVGVGAHRRLLQQAIAEAKSYVTRLFSVIRLLFPDLHDEEFVLLTNTTFSGVCDTPIDSSSLLHPILLPRLYPTLFTLYALHTEKGDGLYAERLYQLNKRGDVALMSFLCVAKKFWLSPGDGEENSNAEATARPYQSAIDALGTISTTYSPMEKISVIRQSFAKLHDEVDNYWKGEHKIACMDDLFPVFQYVVVRARIPHLGSEIQFIEDLVEQYVLVGEAGHMVTTLKACYFQIQKEQDRE